MTILYQDHKWLIIDKPSGISTHRAHPGDLGVVEWLSLHLDLKVHICSRLDKGTSGLLLLALSGSAAAEAQVIHQEEQAQKEYLFIAPKCHQSSWICTEPLDGKPCKTYFSTIREGARYTLYRAVIHRGRRHQIRRHAAAAGIPLLGDRDYDGPPFARVCLHCHSMTWPGIGPRLKSPLPRWFESCLDGVSSRSTSLALAGKRHPFLDTITDCYRLLHRGEYSPHLAVDKYGEWLCVTGFDENLSAQRLIEEQRDMLDGLCQLCHCRGGVVKTNLRDPHKNTLFADIAVWGEPIPQSFLVHEHRLHFGVQLNERQHVGLFLDLRDARRRIASIARGRRVANLFAFTCSFSIYALAAQAEVVFSVDLAAGCLKRGRENVANNHLDGTKNAKFIKEDTRKWLARQCRKRQNSPEAFTPFDLIICDPPVFASAAKGKNFHVEKEWPTLARDIHDILAEDGVALFANNHQAGTETFYFEVLHRLFSKVTRLNPSLDFPSIAGTPAHVRIYWCEKERRQT